jgi:hypothetical protein
MISPEIEKNAFVSRVIWFLLFGVIVLALIYVYRVRNLSSRECSFLDNIYGTIDGNIRSISTNDPNCQYTLKDYYVKTAYNCCSGGSYKNDFVSLCALKNLIRQGVRGFDFEIYNINETPVISSSTSDSFYIKETYNYIYFSDAFTTIINNAFSGGTCPNPTDPVILHFRFKSNSQNIYTSMSNIFKSNNTYLLGENYSFENYNTNLGDTPLLSLQGKIIIIVDRNNTSFLENNSFMEYVNMTSNSMFMRALNYYDVSLTPDIQELQNFNKRNMTIVLPDSGADPVNPGTIVSREAGCQMVAMRYQLVDQNLEENALFFDKAGYAFSLKPERLRYIPDTIPIPEDQNVAYDYAQRDYSTNYYSFQI